MHFPYNILFNKKPLVEKLLKLPKDNKYRSLLAQILRKPNKEIWKILVDSFFMKEYNRSFYQSHLTIPAPLLQIDGHFPTYLSNMAKKLVSNNMTSYHGDLILTNSKKGQGLFSDDVKKKFGTIYTPDFVVDKCIDLAWKYYKGDKLKATYCDPACGDGNFLIALYHKLMQEPSDLSASEKSKHIIENCLFGFDVIDRMVESTRIGLFNCHCKTCGDNFVDIRCNIYHGDTIISPEDIEKDWYVERESLPDGSLPGGLLPDELRDKKYDVIIGNPPYTHLRNLNNRRYAAYPKQRDLAQVFVRWALDHLSEDGVISYNTIDTWLNVKTCDGAKETRQLINGFIAEFDNSDEIKKYSENKNEHGGGGEIPTFLLCLKNGSSIYPEEQLLRPCFLASLSSIEYNFEHCDAIKYGKMKGYRSDNKHGSKTKDVKSFIFKEYSVGDYYLVSKRGLYGGTYEGNWRLVRSSSDSIFETEFESETKAIKIKYEYGLWLVGYLNTQDAKSHVKDWCRLGASHGDWFAIVASGTFAYCQVPDFDYYKENNPQQFQDYMSWIEENMHNKDKFLAGIDEQFDRLMCETK